MGAGSDVRADLILFRPVGEERSARRSQPLAARF
jgi:hypothetical protein